MWLPAVGAAALVVAGRSSDVDIHPLSEADPSACVARHDRRVEAAVGAGTYWLAVDTFVSGGGAQAGALRLVVLADWRFTRTAS